MTAARAHRRPRPSAVLSAAIRPRTFRRRSPPRTCSGRTARPSTSPPIRSPTATTAATIPSRSTPPSARSCRARSPSPLLRGSSTLSARACSPGSLLPVELVPGLPDLPGLGASRIRSSPGRRPGARRRRRPGGRPDHACRRGRCRSICRSRRAGCQPSQRRGLGRHGCGRPRRRHVGRSDRSRSSGRGARRRRRCRLRWCRLR